MTKSFGYWMESMTRGNHPRGSVDLVRRRRFHGFRFGRLVEQGDRSAPTIGREYRKEGSRRAMCEQVCDDIKRSIEFSLENPKDALKDAIKWGRA